MYEVAVDATSVQLPVVLYCHFKTVPNAPERESVPELDPSQTVVPPDNVPALDFAKTVMAEMLDASDGQLPFFTMAR